MGKFVAAKNKERRKKMPFNFSISQISPLMAIIFGILILFNPKLLSTLVAIYLIISGLLGIGIIKF